MIFYHINYLKTVTDLTMNYAWLGGWLFFFSALVEAIPVVGTILPGATMITVGGFLAAHGFFDIKLIIFFAALGAIVGDALGFYLGRYSSNTLLNKKFISQNLFEKGQKFFNGYGNQSLFWGRFFGPLRAIVPLIAGVSQMKQRTFWFWNIFSGISWSLAFCLIGYFSGSLFAVIIHRLSHRLILIIVAIVAGLFTYWLLFKHKGQSKHWLDRHSSELIAKAEREQPLKLLEKHYPASGAILKEQQAQKEIYLLLMVLIILSLFAIIALIFDFF